MAVPCARCDMPLPKWELATSDVAVCTSCGANNRVRIFPAAFRDTTAAAGESAEEGEAACYDHPSKRAVAACGQCGRFVCQLCAVEFGEGVWCPSCVAARAGKAKSVKMETSRTLYDSMALLLPMGALLLYPFMILAAPASLVLTVMTWRRPLSLVRRTRWRFVAAILLSLVELSLCAGIVYVLVRGPAAVRR
jgi:hypothetical protein